MLQIKPDIETFAQIKVIGVGGSGGSAVDRMVKAGIRGVEFIVMNTDVQALHHNSATHKIHIGKGVTRGLGAGMNPEVGMRSAEESQNEIREALKGADMVFVTCGLGGGTGSGAAPVIASIARELGALTVAVVTKPFSFEGPQRKNIGDLAYDEMVRSVDTIISIPNDRILQVIDKKTSLLESFAIVDDVLRQGVQGISELITVPGLINVDFADVKSIMSGTGSALMGIGVAEGENRAVEAAQQAISSPLLELSIDGAKGILFSITGGPDLGMQEVSDAAKIITGSADKDARVIFGAVIDENMGDEIRITAIATGFDTKSSYARKTSEENTSSVSTESYASFSKPLFSSSPFLKKKTYSAPVQQEKSQEDDTEQENDIPQTFPSFKKTSFSNTSFSSKPLEESTNKTDAKNKNDNDQSDADEDLEIPAFIRRKMGV